MPEEDGKSTKCDERSSKTYTKVSPVAKEDRVPGTHTSNGRPKKRGRPPVGAGNGKRLGPMRENHKRAISTSKILNRLIKHAEGQLSPAGVGREAEMTPSQVQASIALLKKYLPDVTSNEVLAEVKETRTVVNKIELQAVPAKTIEHDPNEGGSDDQ